MARIKIKTLTRVHVGSGNLLQLNNDYCIGEDSEGYDVIGVISPRKVLKLIGEENVNTWVTGIERGRSTSEIVQQFKPDAKINQYSSRTIEIVSTKSTETLKECIYDGLNRPYIPGSSIKGAIRTAVMATLAGELEPDSFLLKDKKGRITGSVQEQALFGKDPNSDVFRFLQVGDALFGDFMTEAVRMINVNERSSKPFLDESKHQLIEAIISEDESEFKLKINHDGYNLASNANVVTTPWPECFKSVGALFECINNHTKKLLEEEVDYWDERIEYDEGKITQDYIASIKEMLEEVNACVDNKECVLRIGHGSGWRFITGAWSEMTKDFNSIIKVARPNDHRYEDYDFPKSRRVVGKKAELLGFVKLSVIE